MKKMNLFRYIITVTLLLGAAKLSTAQKDTSKFYAGLEVQRTGIHFVPSFEKMFREGDFWFGANVTYHWHVLGPMSHFSIKNQVLYRTRSGLSFGIQPFWLRAYSKEIGYQVPTSFIVRYDTGLAEVYVDIAYWSKQVYPSIAIRRVFATSTDL